MAKLNWRVKLVAERRPGVVAETELACVERDEAVGLADLGLRLEEAKRLTAALQAQARQSHGEPQGDIQGSSRSKHSMRLAIRRQTLYPSKHSDG